MLKNLIKFIKNKKLEKMLKEKQENRRKYYEIRGAVIKFYEEKDIIEGKVNIPAFQRADQTLKEVIKTPADIDFYYNKLLQYRAVA